MDRLDRRCLQIFPLWERQNKLKIEEIAVTPASLMPHLNERERAQIHNLSEAVQSARRSGKPVILTYGAHLIKNGLAPLVIQMVEDGWITHIATNGAGSIHDWEFAFMGQSSEDVEENTSLGRFGMWEETGRYINLAVAIGGLDGLGYGYSVGKLVEDGGLMIPSSTELRNQLAALASEDRPDESIGAVADMLHLVSNFDLRKGWLEINHRFKEFSVQSAAYRQKIPFTVHPGIGYDIIYTNPVNSGGAIGRGAVRDFLSYADSVSRLGGGGVHITVGSAIMGPMVFEKSLSMANNLSLKKTGKPLSDYHLAVVDIQDGGDWDWTVGEPPVDHPAYYLRFCKSFYRMGGSLDYLCLDNRAFMLGLYKDLSSNTPTHSEAV